MADKDDIDRRNVLTGAGAAAVALLAPASSLAQKAKTTTAPAKAVTPAASAKQARTFFTAHELATLDEIAEAIIPADAKSGGAKAAKVSEYLDQRLAESIDPDAKQSWRDDIAEIDRLSQNMFSRAFRDASPEQRNRLLERISRNEKSPKEPGEFAFGTIKWAVADAYYRTRIGIHDDLEYKGNVLQDEFAGIDVSKR